MLLAEKANRRVRIPDEKKDEYIGMGYTVKNMDGTVIKEPENPKKEAEALSKENTDLKAKLEKATGEIDKLNAAIKAADEQAEALAKENNDLKAKLEEAVKHAENADMKIAGLEAAQKPAETAATGGKGTKAK